MIPDLKNLQNLWLEQDQVTLNKSSKDAGICRNIVQKILQMDQFSRPCHTMTIFIKIYLEVELSFGAL